MKSFVLLFLFLTPACAAFADETPRKGQAVNIVEAVFRDLIATHESEFYCLEFSDKTGKSVEPSEGFMRRFKDVKAVVQKGSDAKIIHSTGTVTDAASGKRGLMLSVTKIKWISDWQVEVSAFVFADAFSAGGYRYSLKKEDGKWIVVGSFADGSA